jgi:hypothetical protein
MRVVSCRMCPATLLKAVPPLNTTMDGSQGSWSGESALLLDSGWGLAATGRLSMRNR